MSNVSFVEYRNPMASTSQPIGYGAANQTTAHDYKIVTLHFKYSCVLNHESSLTTGSFSGSTSLPG
jgi:hypothetical protein